MRAYSYIRFSNLKQQRGESFRRQSEFAANICRENGWQLDDTLTLHDLGVSAFRGKNAKVGALAEFLDAVRSERVPAGSVLIIESIDRLSRNKVGEALQLFISILNSGVSILTLEPRRHYTSNSINEIASLLEPIIYMSRAHEESATKSYRLKDAWAKKKQRAASARTPISRNCPRWLELTENGYVIIPERAATVVKIFELCRDGLGIQRIRNYLIANQEVHKPFGDSGKWRSSYVETILKSRAVFGEYQPGARDEQNQKKTCGSPIENYFPVVVSQELFFAAQSAMQSRYRSAGRPGMREANLFTGIVWCARTKTRMSVISFRSYRYLTSGAVAQGKVRRGNPYSFPYKEFEQAMLQTLSELPVDDTQEDELSQQVQSIQGRIEVIDKRIEEAEKRVVDPTEEQPGVYINIIKALNISKLDMVRQLEEVKGKQGLKQSNSFDSLLHKLESLPLDELEPARQKLKSRIRSIVDAIWVHISIINNKTRVAQAQVFLKNGKRKHILFYSHPGKGRLPTPIEDFSQADLREM